MSQLDITAQRVLAEMLNDGFGLIADLARRLDVPQHEVRRALTTLALGGYVRQPWTFAPYLPTRNLNGEEVRSVILSKSEAAILRSHLPPARATELGL